MINLYFVFKMINIFQSIKTRATLNPFVEQKKEKEDFFFSNVNVCLFVLGMSSFIIINVIACVCLQALDSLIHSHTILHINFYIWIDACRVCVRFGLFYWKYSELRCFRYTHMVKCLIILLRIWILITSNKINWLILIEQNGNEPAHINKISIRFVINQGVIKSSEASFPVSLLFWKFEFLS